MGMYLHPSATPLYVLYKEQMREPVVASCCFVVFMQNVGRLDFMYTGVGVLKLLVSTVMGNFPTALKVWSE